LEVAMKVSVTDAKGQLTDLVRRAEAGDEIVLTRHGHPAVRLVPIRAATDRKFRRALLEDVRACAVGKASPGPSAERSQDFLYGEDGLPK
jgi:prevent-host-death family protein